MTYLTEAEIPIYANLTPRVTMAHVEAASVLIDAFKGTSFEPIQRVERVKLTKRHGELRGKLTHFPRVCVDSVRGKICNVFGSTEVDLDPECLVFDDDTSLYCTFVMPRELMFHKPPSAVTVTYHSGFAEFPEALKRATGLLACNIKQMGGTLRWKQRDDYDIKVTLANEGIMSSEVKAILRGIDVK